jgi:hypothetical protein
MSAPIRSAGSILDAGTPIADDTIQARAVSAAQGNDTGGKHAPTLASADTLAKGALSAQLPYAAPGVTEAAGDDGDA